MLKFSTAIGIALSLTTLGLSLPADAGSANTNETMQTVVINGNNNSVNQSSVSIQRHSGRGNRGNTVASTRTRQTTNIEGNNNRVDQSSETYVRDGRQRR